MKVVVFGASGMLGQGVVRECLLAADVSRVVCVGRRPSGAKDAKLEDVVHPDLLDLTAIEPRLAGYDACFYCLGVTSAGTSEADYRKVTLDYTVSVARTLSRLNPQMTFVFVSGQGTDETGKSRAMWARVKGEAENAVRGMPFRASFIFRPGFIQPLHGIQSRTRLYRVLYVVLAPLVPVLKALSPGAVTTTEKVGRAMLRVARSGYPKAVLGNPDINEAAG